LLIERLGRLSVNVERPTELLRFDQNGQRVRAVLKRPDGSEETCEAAYLAGCDGARSMVREALGIGFPGGTYSGLFYVADVEAAGPAANDEIHVDLERADFLAVFPLSDTGHLRLVGPASWDPEREGRELTFDDVGTRAIQNGRQLRAAQITAVANPLLWRRSFIDSRPLCDDETGSAHVRVAAALD
jgi:2-polyprenyl-6-methoxyphenol hydroxylase-like FAD-dependent oxidoreductase